MVIFAVRLSGPSADAEMRRVTVSGALSWQGGLDEPHAARNSQDASSHRSESEAWIGDEEGSKEERVPREGDS
ncbi:hypothetical protein [Streptomyces sp. NPDC002346]